MHTEISLRAGYHNYIDVGAKGGGLRLRLNPPYEFLIQLPIAFHAFDANCRRQVTITTMAVVTNSTHGLTNQPR